MSVKSIEIKKGNVTYVYNEHNRFMFMIWAKCTLPEKGVRRVVKAMENKESEIVIGEYKISGLA